MPRFHEYVHLSCENFDCDKQYSEELSPMKFADTVQWNDFLCPHCDEELSISCLDFGCYICGADIEVNSVSDVQHWLGEKCPFCAGSKYWDADFYSVVVRGSWADLFQTYDWFERGKSARPLERENRSDYWEGVVHFCEADEFISIYKERKIRAESTGLYKKRNPKHTKAVCLTEAPSSDWDEIKSRHGEYGFVFRKRDIIKLDGAPVIYLPQGVIDDLKATDQPIPPKLWPYLSKLKIPSATGERGKHDFLHEREWRVPQDIEFEDVKPFAITFPKKRPGLDDEELIFAAAQEFQELSGYAEEDASQADPTQGAF
ncbi:hypothetical protein [Rosistilla oblonga]|uniref:hypothetical protein n=1 Tax=Rosistilla oblonga TaxID=2527990 RepID=UPI003A97B5B4